MKVLTLGLKVVYLESKILDNANPKGLHKFQYKHYSVQDGGPLSSLLRPGLAAPGAGRGGQVGRWRGEGGGLGGECLHRFLDISGPEASMATSRDIQERMDLWHTVLGG